VLWNYFHLTLFFLLSLLWACGFFLLSPRATPNQNQTINMKPTRTIHINGWEINKYENYSKVRYVATYRNELGEIVKDFSRQKLSVVKEIIQLQKAFSEIA
jgi:hypothetical protein